MTEKEWLAWADPMPMMEMLRGKGRFRKFWLFTAASCTHASPFLAPDLTQRLATISERLADAKASVADRRELKKATLHWKEQFVAEQDFVRAAYLRDFELSLDSPAKRDFVAARWAIRLASLPGYLGWEPLRHQAQQPQSPRWSAAQIEYHNFQCQLMREIFGNPFHPANVAPRWLEWNGETIPKLAQPIYDEYAFDRLPILADALEEAGCTNADILNHCRQPGEHVRGCWVVDLLLNKS